ncbi:MAG: chemotaxis protein CheW [Desulfatibacillaceae bacterium]
MDLTMLEDFIPETVEHLEEMEAGLLQLEAAPDDRQVLNDVFRAAHTIKGAAEYMGMKKIATLSHALESLLDLLRQGELVADTGIVDALMDSRDRIARLVEDLETSRVEETPIGDLVDRLEAYKAEGEEPPRYEDTRPGDDSEETSDPRDQDVIPLTEPVDSPVESSASDAANDPFADDLLVGEPEPVSPAGTPEEDDDLMGGTVLDMDDALMDDSVPEEDQPVAAHGAEEDDDLFSGTALDSVMDDEQGASGQPEQAGDDDLAGAMGLADDSAENTVSVTVVEDEEDFQDEEYDKELFAIFMDHLKENLSLLRVQAGELEAGADVESVLLRCKDILQGLRSSAGYMDYRRLVDAYDRWDAEIEEILGGLALGREDFSWDFMESFVYEIVDLFPRHEELREVVEQVECPVSPARDEKSTVVEPAPSEAGEPGMHDSLFADDEPEPLVDAGTEHSPAAEEDDDLAPVAPEAPEAPERLQTAPLMAAPDHTGLFDELDSVYVARESTEQANDDSLAPDPFWGDLDDRIASAATSETAQPAREPETGRRAPEKAGTTPSGEVERPAAPRQDKAGSKPAPKTAEKTAGAASKPGLIPEPEIAETPVPERVEKIEQVAGVEVRRQVVEGLDAPPEQEKESRRETGGERLSKQSLRVDARKIDVLMNQVGELVVSRAWLAQLFSEMRDLQHHLQDEVGLEQKEMKPVKNLTFRLSEATVALGRVANELQEGVMKVRMLPISQLFNRYPRLVRDLVHDTDKKVRLDIVGEETELDKMVIEEIADPLVHVIRNAVDHGVESEKDRIANGKPGIATIRLESYHESNNVVVEISDDGRGIDPERIRDAALKKDLVPAEELSRMARRELVGLIMRPGFSTAEKVTTTSGRGVGMDVVKKNVEKLNGTVEIDSDPGKGTRVRIKIPLTLAIIQALLVRVGEDIFTVPLAAVEETMRVFEKDITVIEGVEVIHLREGTLSLLRLSEMFNIDSDSPDDGKAYVVVVNTGMQKVGIVVDALIGQEETVIKPLVDYLQEKSGFSGATVLGDGSISLILDVYELVTLSMGRQQKRRGGRDFAFDNWRGKNAAGGRVPASGIVH